MKSQINPDVIVGDATKKNNEVSPLVAEPYLGGVQPGSGKHKVVLSRKFLVLGLSIVFLVAVALGLFVFGYLSIIWKQPKQQVVVTYRVCGDDVVVAYNKASQLTQTNGTGQYVIDEAGLKKLATEVKTKKNYQNDPTCQTILLAVAIHNQDYNAAKDAYNAVKGLHDKYIYADSNLNVSGSLSAYESLVQELSPTKQGSDGQEPQGGA